MKKMVYIIIVFYFSIMSLANPPEHTISWNLGFTCKDSSSEYCYPFLYMTSDSEISWFPNVVSALNVLAPVFTIGTLSTNYWLSKKIQKNINEQINEEVKIFDDLENQLKEFLIKVIAEFENNIGSESEDLICLDSVLNTLNVKNCDSCTKKFVDIVSEKVLTSSENNNRIKFVNFANELILEKFNQRDHGCELNEIKNDYVIKISQNQKDYNSSKIKKYINNSVNKSSHPFHLTNTLFSLVAWSACSITPQFLDIDNRAGSYLGDMANIMNIIVIPVIGPLSIFQQILNKDKEKEQKIHEKIIEKITKLNGIIEISALVIGKMDNQISLNEAKGFIKALFVTKWPENLKNLFLQAASEGNLESKKELQIELLKALKQGFPYYDEDIEEALNKTKETEIIL